MKLPCLLWSLLLGSTSLIAQQQKQLTDSLINPLISLEEVSVSGLRVNENQPLTFSEVQTEALKERNLGQDLPILLNFLPGVVTTSDAGAGIGYTGIRVRGSDASRVNVTINGIPYNDSESQGTFWVNLPDFTSSVDNIQLNRGVGTSTNGAGAFGASLNLITQGVSDLAFAEIASSFGSFNTIKNTVKFSTGLLNEHFELSGRVATIASDGYIDRASSDLKSYFFQGLYKDKNTLIKALTFGGSEITYQSWYGIDSGTLAANRTYNPAGEMYDSNGVLTGHYDNQVDDYKQDHFQFHWTQQYNSSWSSTIGLNYTYGRGYYEEYNDLWATQNITFGDEVNFDYLQIAPLVIGGTTIDTTENISRKWLDNNFYVGTFSLNYDSNQTSAVFGGSYSSYNGDHFGNLIWAQYASNAAPNHRFYENNADKKDFNLYTKVTQQLGTAWTVYADVQFRTIAYNSIGTVKGPEPIAIDDNLSFFNPKAGITYRASEASRLYLSYAKAQREPNRSDYENGTPKPESLNDFEAGWRFKKEKVQLQANLYYMDYENQLVLTGALDAVGEPIRTNSGDSYRFGLEIEAAIQFAEQWVWQPNLALSSNKNKDFYFKRDGQLQNLGTTNISYSPNVVGASNLVFAPSTVFRVALLSKYVGEQFMGNIDADLSKLEAYFTNDINISYVWTPNSWINEAQFSLLVNNIFNALYTSNGYFYTFDDDYSVAGVVTTIEGVGYYPQAGTNFLMGATFRF
ncbi:TonB-dependent receptor [Flavobacteriaceae bacterium]|nr:TonB-dependent receptor [Flavobacteriaceae bacterium]